MAGLNFFAPFFIVADAKASAAFYVDKLGFEVKFMEPKDDPFFVLVGRNNVLMMLKAINTDTHPVPNYTRHEWARWDAYVGVDDPDALYKEFGAKGVTFHQPLDNDEGLRGFEVADADGYILFFGRTEH